MPIALDPAQTVPFSLAVDRDTPADIRPTFDLGYLTCRQTLRYEELINQAADKTTTQAEDNATLNQALALLIRGWRNLLTLAGEPLAFEPGDPGNGYWPVLDDVLTAEEKWEFALEARKAIRLSESDQKKSRSQPATGTEKSVPAAPSNAETNPQS